MDARLAAAVVVAGGGEGDRVEVGAGGGMESAGVENVAEVEAPLPLRARVFPSTPRHKVAAVEVAAKAQLPQVLLPV